MNHLSHHQGGPGKGLILGQGEKSLGDPRQQRRGRGTASTGGESGLARGSGSHASQAEASSSRRRCEEDETAGSFGRQVERQPRGECRRVGELGDDSPAGRVLVRCHRPRGRVPGDQEQSGRPGGLLEGIGHDEREHAQVCQRPQYEADPSTSICGPACERQVWEDGLIHCSKVCQHLPGDTPWERNLEVAPVEKERDDLERVRKEAASRGKGVGTVKEKPKKDRSSSPGTSGESKAKKKKKKKKKKKERLRIEAIKPLSQIFGKTGMDSDASIRRRFKKRAKKLSKKGKSKKEGDTSSSGSSDSSSTMDVQEDAITGLFAEQTAVQRMWHRFPGVLTAQLLQDIQRTMLLQLGTMNASPDQLTPIVSQYVRQHLSTIMSPVVFREAAHWGACLDCMIQGRTAAAVDIMSQRLKALESLSKGMAVGATTRRKDERSENGSGGGSWIVSSGSWWQGVREQRIQKGRRGGRW